LYLRKKLLDHDEAEKILNEAEDLLEGREFEVSSSHVLALTQTSSCSSYDCEYVALAQNFNIPLVTADKIVLKEFSAAAVSPAVFVSHPV
jgi:predicted nucleic acid-binding protein